MHDLVNILHALTVNLRPWTFNIKPLQTVVLCVCVCVLLWLLFWSLLLFVAWASSLSHSMLKRTCQAESIAERYCKCERFWMWKKSESDHSRWWSCRCHRHNSNSNSTPHFDCHANAGKCIPYISILLTPIFLSLLFALINTSNKIQLLQMLPHQIGIMRWLLLRVPWISLFRSFASSKWCHNKRLHLVSLLFFHWH